MNLGGVSMYRYNDTVTAVIYLLIQIKIIQQILFNLYLWQLKEYRLDRFSEHIGRIYPNKFLAFLGLTLLSPIKFPQKSAKAMLIFILNLLFNSVFFLFNSPFIALLAVLFTPFVFSVSLCLIYPFEKMTRVLIYALASRKIRSFHQKNQLTIIGITGSYGKSTTKSFINQILSLKFNTLATPKSVNTPLAIALLTLRKLTKKHRFFIVEMGAYKIGEIKELCQIVNPQIGIVTGISNQHLALFGNQENINKAKSELLDNLTSGGLAIINKQSAYLPIIPQEKMLKIIFYEDKKFLEETVLNPLKKPPKEQVARVPACRTGREGLPTAGRQTALSNVPVAFDATSQPRLTVARNEVSTGGKETRDRIWNKNYTKESYINHAPIPDFLKINLEPALILAKLYNIDDKEIEKKLSNLNLPQKTMQKIKGYGNATIIDDSYNSSFEGTIAALEYLQKLKGKKIVVMPCLIELGQESLIIHHKIGEKLAKLVDFAVITTADYFTAIKKGAGESQKIICFPHPKKAIDFLCTIVNEKSIILIEGKVHSSIIKFLIQ